MQYPLAVQRQQFIDTCDEELRVLHSLCCDESSFLKHRSLERKTLSSNGKLSKGKRFGLFIITFRNVSLYLCG